MTPDERAANRDIARIRMRIEHVIGSVKRCGIVKDTLRLCSRHSRDQVMETCCGVHTFRPRDRPWSYTVSHQS